MEQPRLFETRQARAEKCPSEEKRVGGKSYCIRMGCWTSCRECGWCVAAELGK